MTLKIKYQLSVIIPTPAVINTALNKKMAKILLQDWNKQILQVKMILLIS